MGDRKMLYLYHAPASVCAMKVRLALTEKALPWDGEMLDLRRGDQFDREYRKLNPNAVVPTLVHDGRVIVESTVIIEYLDEAFPSPQLMSAEPYHRAVARLWMKKIDDYLHGACATLTFAIAFRGVLLRKTREEREARFAAIPDPAMRERQRQAVTYGIEAPDGPPALRSFDKFIGEMEDALARSPYLAGDAYSLADVATTPYVHRGEILAMDRLWGGRRPHVADWYARMRERPSFEDGIARYMTEGVREHFDVSREETWQKIDRVLTHASP
jgi:glutathione S-transferase